MADTSWANLDIDSGVIALSDDYVTSNGLPEAMRFPWDDTKGVYFVNAHHNLHCLVSSRTSNRFPVIMSQEFFQLTFYCSEEDIPRAQRVRS